MALHGGSRRFVSFPIYAGLASCVEGIENGSFLLSLSLSLQLLLSFFVVCAD
ncbi:hypothetical protein CSUI_007649 [Cystoisospora suis]|uniref:Uncharacterized protein n=1 Tax=Cystoisospora suis TaxID=483139 RepID=A0A2C6KQ61_9APIC|nr:hypothetical protein CSUI_007649 [Cystoisospora suis]